jgi:uncharacterized SAM-binding protein YcdF (DUF218 family)
MKFLKRKRASSAAVADHWLGDDYGLPRDLEGKRPGRLRYFAHGLGLVCTGAIVFASAGAISGRTMIEKMMTDLVMPLGLVWAGLLLIVYFCFLMRQWWPAIIGLACWLVLTLAGNFYVSNWLISKLEMPFLDMNVWEMEPLDTMVVLGGGTNTRMGGGSQLGRSGDRVGTAARMFHAGQAKRVLCTGTDSFLGSDVDLHPREEAIEILAGLGIARDNLFELEGKNTFQEMQNLKVWLAENPDQQRIGVLSSAWHLPRVIRLAESNGLELIPVPADFLSQPYEASPNFLIPSSAAMETTRAALKEYLAGWLGR